MVARGDRPDATAIREWLIVNLSEMLGMEPETIDTREPFADYGLDSIAAVSLSADLEEWLDRPLSSTLAWDYPCIDSLARHLGQSTDAVR